MRSSVAVAVACLSMIGISAAGDVEAASRKHTTIPPQGLAPALQQLAADRDIQLVYRSEIVGDRRTSGASGEFTVDEALTELLSGTGLTYEYLGEKAVTIIPAPASLLQGAGGGSQDADGDYSDSLQGRAGKGITPSDRDAGAGAGSRSENQDPSTNSTTESDDESGKRRSIEEIVITGSRIRGARNASPVVTITREEINQAGFATVEELIDRLPQNFGAGASLDTNNDLNNTVTVGGLTQAIGGGTSVNLRGLGASSTLILLNGRRKSPSGFSARFTNISSIPVSAIERVDVLTDGASAIYGSDAIGGVVNFVLRDDYEGAETRLRYGSDSRGDTSNILFGQSFGNSWEDGNILLTYEYYDSDNLANEDRDIASSSDLSRFGGTDTRTPGGNPANIDAGGQLFAIPGGQDGTSLTAADFDPEAPLNLYNERSIGDVLPELERHNAFLHLTQNIGEAEFFVEGQFSSQVIQQRINRRVVDINVPDSNPFFVDPTGAGLTTVTVENYSFEGQLPRIIFGELDSFGAALGVRFDINENWDLELAGNLSNEEAIGGDNFDLDRDALIDAVNQIDPSLAFNPFSVGPTNPVVLESFVDRSRLIRNESENELLAASLNINGEAFNIPGGAIQIATGVEFREESLLVVDPDPEPFATEFSRDVLAVYTELLFPLVGSANSRPGLQRFEVSVAARHEEYSDFGGSKNPKVGIVWSPTEALTVKGTLGTSFRAPSLSDLAVSNPNISSSAYLGGTFVDLGLIPFPTLVRIGGNPDLAAEEATTWTAGLQWSTESLSLDVTYFNIDFENRIDVPTGSIVALTNDPRFSSLFNTDPTPEQIAAIVNDPIFDETGFGGAATAAEILSGAAPVGGIADGRRVNSSQVVVTGAELQFGYQFETGIGLFDVGANGSYLFDFKRALVATDPLFDEVDTFGRPIDFRARGNVTWSRQGWSVSGFLNYLDSYTDNLSDPLRSIDSWFTVDLTIAFDTSDANAGGIFSDTRLLLTTQNLFDEDPPFVNTQFGGLAYDSANGDPLGRVLSFQITKEW